MAFDLEGRVVLVTGAGGAIGSASARTLAAAGASVLAHDVRAESVEAVTGELGSRAHAFVSDLADPAAVGRLWDEALAVHGRIDVLVNNAGIFPAAELDAPLDDWVRVWNLSLGVNLVAPAILCKAAVNTFSGQPDGGIIVNMASRAAFRGEDPGLLALRRREGRGRGHDPVDRPQPRAPGRDRVRDRARLRRHGLQQRFATRSVVDVAARDTGLGEVAMPQDVANVVAFLASGLARHATGTTIDINGASYVR